MRPGGGKDKGSAWEREVCRQLSLWIGEGARTDLFVRNVISGGQFTVRSRQGDSAGVPGDVMAAHPLSYRFLSLFSIECKHHASLNLTGFLHDARMDRSFLAQTYNKAEKQANQLALQPLIIAKENHRPAWVLLPAHIGKAARTGCIAIEGFSYHSLHQNRVWLVPFDVLTGLVIPATFLVAVEEQVRLRDGRKQVRDYHATDSGPAPRRQS